MRKRAVTAPVSAVSSLRTSALACSQLNSRPCRRRDLHGEDFILGAEPLVDGPAAAASMPSPVTAETSTGRCSLRAMACPTSMRAAAESRSALFHTSNSGRSAPSAAMPRSARTASTSCLCASVSGWLMSRTCKMRSASITSSSVARNAATSVVGRSEMKPTVSDRIALPAARKPQLAHGRIERLEHLVLGRDRSARQAVEQRRLAGIGVADDGHHRKRHALAAGAMQAARLDDHGQFLADRRDALVDQTAVGFDLRFARAAEEAVAAALALKMGPGPHQPALLVGQMGKLHLQPAFARQRALPEDFENEARAIEDLAPPCLFEIALLHGRHDVIDDREAGILRRRSTRRARRPCPSRTASTAAARAAARSRPLPRRAGWRAPIRPLLPDGPRRNARRPCRPMPLPLAADAFRRRTVRTGTSTTTRMGGRSRSTGARRLRAGPELDGLVEMAIPVGLRPGQYP